MAGKLGGILGIIGAILLIVTLFVAYYSFTGSSSVGSQSVSFTGSLYLNNKIIEEGSSGGTSISMTYSYSDLHLNNTGNLYNIVTYLTYAGIALGLIGAIIALMGRGIGRIVLVLALILALVGPILLFAEQPTAFKNDLPSGSTGTGPQSSFIGSCSGSNCGSPGGSGSNATASWGPSVGWYLAIGAFVVFLIAVLTSGGAAKPAPSAAAAPSASTAAGGANTCASCGASFGTPEELQAHNQSAHGGT